MDKQDGRDYLIERAGIREFSGGMKIGESEAAAREDYNRYLRNENEYRKLIEGRNMK